MSPHIAMQALIVRVSTWGEVYQPIFLLKAK